MAEKTKIEWAESSWNPIRAGRYKGEEAESWSNGWHCEIITPGCENCYAEAINKRLGTGLSYLRAQRASTSVFLDEKILTKPLRWKRPRRIFVCSMSDLFGEWVPDEMLDRIFEIMGACDDQGLGHTFQILTKRAERQRDYMKSAHAYVAWNKRRLAQEAWPPRNIWSGVSVEDQRRADERIPLLLETPAAVRFLSVEPMLGPVDLRLVRYDEHYRGSVLHGFPTKDGGRKVDWVIVGGESGPRARPMHPDWPRSLRDQCVAAGVSYFFKQWGEFAPVSHFQMTETGREVQRMVGSRSGNWIPAGDLMRVGKKAAGRLLDGREWSQYPEARA